MNERQDNLMHEFLLIMHKSISPYMPDPKSKDNLLLHLMLDHLMSKLF